MGVRGKDKWKGRGMGRSEKYRDTRERVGVERRKRRIDNGFCIEILA